MRVYIYLCEYICIYIYVLKSLFQSLSEPLSLPLARHLTARQRKLPQLLTPQLIHNPFEPCRLHVCVCVYICMCDRWSDRAEERTSTWVSEWGSECACVCVCRVQNRWCILLHNMVCMQGAKQYDVFYCIIWWFSHPTHLHVDGVPTRIVQDGVVKDEVHMCRHLFYRRVLHAL